MPTPTPYQESPPATLPEPCPTQPVADQPVETDAPAFDWTSVPDATRYRVQIASSEDFASLHYDEPMDRGDTLSLDSVLPENATHLCWRVRAEADDEVVSEWSDPARFAVATGTSEEETTVRVDAPPVPLRPDDRQAPPVDQRAVTFSWEGIPEATGYQLHVAATEDFDDPSVDLTVDQTTSVTLYDALPSEAASLYWRVRPLFRVATPGPWSSPTLFTVASPSEAEEDLAPEAADPQASARASGPVEHARTSGRLSVVVGLIAILSFVATLILIFAVVN